jgi:hypothetical protein
MTLSLHDHERRLRDLETAMDRLLQSLAETGQLPALREAARRARVHGARGAAELLERRPAAAAYRRSARRPDTRRLTPDA